MPRVLDLFSGIGGFSLGLERTGGFKTVAFCEIEPFCRKVLRKHWPDVPIYEDVRELTAERLVADGIAVDVICGGFPCQDISHAGKGAGIEGERSGLWSEYARLIGELRPGYVIVENVAALLGRGLERVLGDLAALGYDAEWHCIPAAYVGAPHRRDRVWIIAHPQHSDADDAGLYRAALHINGSAEFRDEQVGQPGPFCADVAYADQPRLEGRNGASVQQRAGECTARTSSASMADAQGSGWRAGRSRRSAGVGARVRQPALSDANIIAPIGAAIARRECSDWLAKSKMGGMVDGISAELHEGRLNDGLEITEGCSEGNKSNGQGLRGLWRSEQTTAPPSRLQQADRSSNPLPRLPCEGRPEGRSSENETAKTLQGMREAFHASSQQEALDMQSRVSFGSWPHERDEALGIWEREPDTPRVAPSIANRVDRLKGLGNAVVSQIPELIGRAILEAAAA